MGLTSDYRFYREGDWGLLVNSQIWNQGLWAETLRHFGEQVSTHHPRTKTFHYRPDGSTQEFYIKIMIVRIFWERRISISFGVPKRSGL